MKIKTNKAKIHRKYGNRTDYKKKMNDKRLTYELQRRNKTKLAGHAGSKSYSSGSKFDILC